jgi:hypothetical protein
VTIEQILLQEIEESKRWLNLQKDESTYKRDLVKRIELINWVLKNMKNPEINICDLIESKMNDIINIVNRTHSIFETDKGHNQLGILDCILC